MNWVQTHASPLFTPTEAAVLTRLSLKAVNNAIDKRTIPAVPGNRAGHATRLLDIHALMSLTLERRLADRFAPELRRQLFAALPAASRAMLPGASRTTVSLEGGFLKVDLRESRRELATSIRLLRRARQLVHSHPDIMGGDPVFRGTRIQVHMIAGQLEQGATETDLLEDYPRMTAEMLQLAPLYSAAYPLRGRPRRPSWHDHPPVQSSRRRLSDFEAA